MAANLGIAPPALQGDEMQRPVKAREKQRLGKAASAAAGRLPWTAGRNIR
jgi:hypothetical protein